MPTKTRLSNFVCGQSKKNREDQEQFVIENKKQLTSDLRIFS